ncbi:Fc.00g106380.m01.CDS01 [Cosmosporella sp. VM-42]
MASNQPSEKGHRPIRIGNASGAIGDGIDQVYRLASSGAVDAITADYLAEFNIAWKAIELQTQPDLGYEPNFLEQLAWENGAGARALANNRVKVVHDGGALNPKGLAKKVDTYFRSLGIRNIKVAWIEGDNVTEHVKSNRFGKPQHLDQTGRVFQTHGKQILAANVYTGQRGIIKALEQGADIVICGRCCDASPVMGLASWWHGWKATDYQELAGSLMAGHIIECGAYVTGGNYCGQQEVPQLHHVGYPIAEISADGTSIITKPEGTNGQVTVDTCKGQLLYEIQGPNYLNPDVIAEIDGARLEKVGKDRVRLTGIVGLPPPDTAKVAICVLGGYQAEISAYAAGLDTDFKFNLMKDQVLRQINPEDFTTFSIEKYGSSPVNPRSQKDCTVQFRMFAQSPKKEAFTQFRRAIFYNGMQGYCGLHLGMDWRTMEPKPYVSYFPALVQQGILPDLAVHFVTGEKYDVPPPTLSGSIAVSQRPSGHQTATSNRLSARDKTVTRPLGDLLFARSGDKGGNANIGFWVRDPAAYPFAQSFLTVPRVIELLADDWDPKYSVERCEFPNLNAVHFVIKGILQDGVSSSSVLDGFGKSIGEFLRARVVELPEKLVEVEDRCREEALKRGCAAQLKL